MDIYSKLFNNILLETNYPLIPESVDMASEAVGSCLEKQKISHTDMLRLRLRLESILIGYMEAASPYQDFTVKVYKKCNRVYVHLAIGGAGFNCLDDGTNEYTHALLTALDGNKESASYSYRHGMNKITFKLPQKPVNPIFYTFAAIVAAVLTGVFFSNFAPELGLTISEKVFQPVFLVLIGLLKMISSLMVFFAVVAGVCSLGDINSFSKQGRVILSTCIGRTLEGAAIATLICVLLFPIVKVGNDFNLSLFVNLLDNILKMIPINVVTPFTEGNAMQILFLALGAGALILMNIERTEALIENIKQLNIIVMSGVTSICHLVPLIVYLSVAMMILDGSIKTIYGAWKIPAVLVLVSVLLNVSCLVRAALRLKRPFLRLLLESLPIGLLGFSTASSAACTGKVIELCQHKYAMEQTRTSFYYPMLQMFFKPHVAATFILFIYITCADYGISLPLTTIIVNILVYTLMALSLAPVPASDIPLAVILIASAGLPNETVAVYTTIAFVMDMIATGSITSLYSTEIACIDKENKN